MSTSKLRWLPAVTLLAGLGLPGCSSGQAEGTGNSFMEQFFPPSPSEVARDAFNVYDPDLRRRSINLLSNAPWGGEEPYLRTYRIMLDPQTRDDDPTVRAACLRALGRHGGPEDVPRVVRYLDTKEPDYVRVEAAVALQRLHHPDAIEPLMAAVRGDEDPEVRRVAAHALGHYADPRVFQVLVGALNDEDYAVVDQAVDTLQLLTGKQFGEDGAAWLAWADQTQDLFAEQRVYYYPQFVKPPGTLQKLQFWKDSESPPPRQPAGLEAEADGEPASTSGLKSQGPEEDALAVPSLLPSERPAGAVAVLVEGHGAQWDPSSDSPQPEEGLTSEFLRLKAGQAVVQFYGGAKVALYGPTEFAPHSESRTLLRHGKILVAVPAASPGFVISGPGLTVVDRAGGRFGLVVHGDGVIEVHAFEADVDVSFITSETGILKMVPVSAGRVARVQPSGAVRISAADASRFSQIGVKPPPAATTSRPLGTPEDLRARIGTQVRSSAGASSKSRDIRSAPPSPLGASDAPQ